MVESFSDQGPLLNRTSAKPFVLKAVSVSLAPVHCLGAGKWSVHFCMGSIHDRPFAEEYRLSMLRVVVLVSSCLSAIPAECRVVVV